MILNLYFSILIPVVSEWLCPVEVCLLDTAVCNHSHREGFLSLLSNCVLFNSGNDNSDSIFEWLEVRGAKLNGFNMFSLVSPAVRRVLMRTKHLQWVTTNPESLASVMELCPSVGSVKLIMGISKGNFLPLLPELRNMTSLDLGYCKVNHRINEGIAESCPHLVSFRSPNESTAVVEGCKELTEVSCVYSHATAKALCDLSLSSLTFFYSVTESASYDTMIRILDQNHGLRALHLHCGKFDDKLAIFASTKCVNLTDLHFNDGTAITDDGLRSIAAHCKGLKDFQASSKFITDAGVSSLVSSCSFITALSLVNCGALTDVAVLTILRTCFKLNRLETFSPLFTDVAFCRAFAVCPSLTHIFLGMEDFDTSGKLTSAMFVSNAFDLEDIELSGGGIKMFKKFKVASSMFELLALVDFEYNALLSLFMQSPRLIRLHLDSVEHVDETFIKDLAKCCPLITDLTVKESEVFSGSCIPVVLRHCANLKKLTVHFTNQWEIDDEEEVGDANTTLSPLISLVVRDSLSHNFLDAAALMCPSLKSILLSGCNRVDSSAVNNVLQKCSLLSDVEFNCCELVDGSVLTTLTELGRKMSSVNVSGCPLITKTDVMKFVRVMDNLIVKLSV